MHYETVILVVVIAVAGLISFVGFRKSPRAPLSLGACILGTLSPLLLAAFGTFGFVACFEYPATPARHSGQLAYGLLAAGAVITSGCMAARFTGRRSKR